MTTLLWFPPNERTRATSIGQMFNALGVGVSYLLGNTIVSREETGETEDRDAEPDIMILLSVYSSITPASHPSHPATLRPRRG